MARVPEIIRRNPVSQVAADAPQAGQGFAALADVAGMVADFVKPAALGEAREAGEKSVYRDDTGTLRVEERSLYSGELGMAQNSAAYASYAAQKQIDINQTMQELSVKYQFDPAGFQGAADGYVKIMQTDESIPSVLKDDIVNQVRTETARTFNGLKNKAIDKTYREADRNTKTARDLLIDDYVSLYVEGDEDAAAEKWTEIEQMSRFRADAPYISETPAETESYMRGARGAAKGARLIRDLTDLEGATEISDEARGELEAVLKDPDISPQTRQKLYAATQGRLKGIDAAGIVKGLTDDSYEGMVVKAESGGRDDAQAATSSAFGPHQFLKGTWSALVDKYKPEWAEGLSEGQLQSLRGDRQKSSEMFAHFRRENQQALSNAGLPVNAATEYMAHFFGAGGAVQVLSSDPNAMLSDVVSPQTIEANKFLSNMTVRDAQVWAARKMTMKASDMANMQVDINRIEDDEVRALASKSLSDRVKERQAIEQAAASVFEERLVQGDPTVTRQEILENHDLSNDDQGRLTRALETANKKAETITATINDITSGEVAFDALDTNDRNRVNEAYESVIGDEVPLSETGMGVAATIAEKTGIIPKKAGSAIKGAVASDDPVAVSGALEALSGLKDKAGSLQSVTGAKTLEGSLSDYAFYGEFMGGEQAAQRIIDNREKKPKNVTDEAKEAAKKLDISDVVDRLDTSWLSDPNVGVDGADLKSTPLLSGPQQDEMMSEYNRLFQDAYVDTGDFDLSQNRALDEMQRVYGVDDISGGNRVMKYPPNKVYAPVAQSYDWMQEQLVSEVNDLVFGDSDERVGGSIAAMIADGASMGAARPNIPRDSINLVSDGQTAADVRAGRPASYIVYFQNDGMWDQAPQRFTFDRASAVKAQIDPLKDKRARRVNDDPQANYYRNVEKFGKERADEMLREAQGITAR